ncbi:MAG: hypothetical protein ABI675_20245 [Chitinophagaceae bacterium]
MVKKTGRFIVWAFLLLVISYILFVRSFLMHWGSTTTEISKYYAGDSILLQPDYENTLTITINKPASAIWPWVAQMGLNKAGFYSFTWLENFFGCKLHNANRIHPEWQNPQPGDYEPVCASAEKNNMKGWTIAIAIINKALVYKSSPDSSWMMGFYIDSVSKNKSRLVTRMRYITPKQFWLCIADKVWMEWAHCIMQKGSINGIKKRAEKN